MLGSLVVKIAFIYISDKQAYLHNNNYVFTARVSAQISPDIHSPHPSIAISKVDKVGTIRPLVIYRPTISK